MFLKTIRAVLMRTVEQSPSETTYMKDGRCPMSNNLARRLGPWETAGVVILAIEWVKFYEVWKF